MRVTINGKTEEVAGSTVLEILRAKDVSPQMVAVELNSKMLEREELGSALVKDGDAIGLLFYLAGGDKVLRASSAITACIGATPLIRLNRLSPAAAATISARAEHSY